MIIFSQRLDRRERLSGFSLAEVLMAMAITSFALLTLLAVLPEGLNSLQDAQRQAAEARIVQQLTTQFQMTPWSQLDQAVSAAGSEVLFDADGNRLLQDTDNNRAFFRVRLSLVAGLPPPNESLASPYFRRLRMEMRLAQNQVSVTSDNTLHTERFASIVNLDKADPPASAGTTESGTGGRSSTASTAPNP